MAIREDIRAAIREANAAIDAVDEADRQAAELVAVAKTAADAKLSALAVLLNTTAQPAPTT